ncbi:threonine-phosphate decarboxylase CobD [Bacillus songklensis]|uniref:threonine-phosphate decarboxylase n=1 Tax=Bacillus songklensis TaxID=1069116 RepID=A0ABV8AZ88_9BACI
MFLLLPSHGANPHLLLQELKVEEKQSVIDFSVNINPLGVPNRIVELWPFMQKAAFSYPSVQAEELTVGLALHLTIKQDELLVTNGAAEAFFLIAGLLTGKKSVIVDPTFVEYRQACEVFGCDIVSVPLDEREGWQWSLGSLLDAVPLADAIWICHPNNPTGVMYPLDEWEVLLEQAKAHNTILIIDEAFLDFVDSPIDFIPYLKKGYPIILVRSMTKMFHIAGIRLGYIISSPNLISLLSERQPPWSVNGVAQQIGVACLRETSFVQETIAFVKKEREWLMEQLLQLGLIISPSVTNFFLCSIPNGWSSRGWLTYLAKEGIVARHTENFNGLDGRFIRLAVKTRLENERLVQVIKKGLTGYVHFC